MKNGIDCAIPFSIVLIKTVRMKGVEPPRLAALDPKSSVYCTKETQKHSLSITYVFCHFL